MSSTKANIGADALIHSLQHCFNQHKSQRALVHIDVLYSNILNMNSVKLKTTQMLM